MTTIIVVVIIFWHAWFINMYSLTTFTKYNHVILHPCRHVWFKRWWHYIIFYFINQLTSSIKNCNINYCVNLGDFFHMNIVWSCSNLHMRWICIRQVSQDIEYLIYLSHRIDLLENRWYRSPNLKLFIRML